MERLPPVSCCISTVYHEIDSFLCQGLLAVALEVSSLAPQICQLQLTSIYVGQQFQDKVILGLVQKFMPSVVAFTILVKFFPIELRHQQSYIAGTFLLASLSFWIRSNNTRHYTHAFKICIHVLILFQFDGS